MTNSSSPSKKQSLRGKIRQLPGPTEQEAAIVRAAAQHWLAARPDLRTVALYAATKHEVDLLPLTAANSNRCWVFPRVCGVNLVLHAVRDPAADLSPGHFGILEPSPALPIVEVAAVDVFLCPGLAFDPRGGRLGRGRGFYDRLLANARPDALKIGICHPAQCVADTFPEPHDVIMDEVICGGD